MPTTYRRYQPDQPLLLPPDLQEWVPPGHLAHHVSDVVDALDLTSFYAPYEGDGRRNAPYEPSMMVKVLIYAYATGTFSSRAVARKLEEDVAFRMLAAGNFPQHRTVCEFRRRHLGEFSELFVQVVRVAREIGGHVAFRMLAAGNFPQHRTVCEFRRRHLGEFSELFVQVVRVAREIGLARFGKLSVDGTIAGFGGAERARVDHARQSAQSSSRLPVIIIS